MLSIIMTTPYNCQYVYCLTFSIKYMHLYWIRITLYLEKLLCFYYSLFTFRERIFITFFTVFFLWNGTFVIRDKKSNSNRLMLTNVMMDYLTFYSHAKVFCVTFCYNTILTFNFSNYMQRIKWSKKAAMQWKFGGL